MKRFFMFFVIVWRFIVNLFSSKKNQTASTVSEKVETAKEEAKRVFRRPLPQVHNNRKNTRGRFTQHVNLPDGRTKAIQHSVKQ